MADRPPLLSVHRLAVTRQDTVVVSDVDLTIGEGEAVAILGPNGAGKSSFVDAVCGLATKRRGSVAFAGIDITSMPVHRIARLGLIQVPQDRDLFPQMTVQENLIMGRHALGSRRAHVTIDGTLDDFPQLRERRSQKAISLSGGEQKMLAIARALVGRPRLLVLDEPSAGLAPDFVGQLRRLIGAMIDRGLTIMLVEQNVDLALALTTRLAVLRAGVKVFDGPSGLLGADPRPVLARTFFA